MHRVKTALSAVFGSLLIGTAFLSGAPEGSGMPKGLFSRKLSQDDLDLIRLWIQAGAPD